MAARRSNYDKTWRMVSQFGPRGDEQSLTLEVTGRNESAVRIAANEATGLLGASDQKHFERRCLNDWQNFASGLGHQLGCASITSDIQAAVGKLLSSHHASQAKIAALSLALEAIALECEKMGIQGVGCINPAKLARAALESVHVFDSAAAPKESLEGGGES